MLSLSKNTIKLAVEALVSEKRRVAFEANAFKLGATGPRFEAAHKRYSELSSAISEIELESDMQL